MRAAHLGSVIVVLTGCVTQPLSEPAIPLQNSEDVAPATQEPSPDSGPHRERHVTWFDTGQKAEEGWIVDGRRHGPWETWYPLGRKKWEGEYNEGDPVGVWKYWNENGNPELEKSFVNGELSMVRRFGGASLSAEEQYRDGVREGQWTRFTSKGVTLRHYSNGATVADPWESDTVHAIGYRLKYAPDAGDRLEAVLELAQHDATSWTIVGDLMRGLSDPDPRVVRESAVVLGILGTEAHEAVERLTELTEHEQRPIAEAAKTALRQIEGGRVP